jgi:hypothetical protein
MITLHPRSQPFATSEDCSQTRKRKLIDRSENTLDNSRVEPRGIKAVGLHDSYSITTGCEIQAVHVGG